MKINEDEFNQIVLEAVDAGLSCLGELVAIAVYTHLEMDGVEKARIPEELDRFSVCLHKLFGSGAVLIESMIGDALYTLLGISCEERKGRPLKELVIQARSIARNSGRGKGSCNKPWLARCEYSLPV